MRLRRVLSITLAEHLATIMIERGLYFYTHEKLGFSDVENLLLTLGFGAFYVLGALGSHGLAKRLGERRLLATVVFGQLAVYTAMGLVAGPTMLVPAALAAGWLNGTKWPLVESYVSAGRTPRDNRRVVGWFNLTWSATIPVGLVAAGPLIATWPPLLFFVAAGGNVVASILLVGLPRRPVHLPMDHPERPDAWALERLRALLASSRWSMVTSYSLMWVLVALMPGVFERLGRPVTTATGLSGVLDAARVSAFLVLQLWPGWHNRRLPLALVIPALPAGFFMVLFGPNLATVLAGEILFGAAAGMTYYAALYYALVVKNASVDAGGTHEGLIGSGFVIGPASGLLGRGLAGVMTVKAGMITGLAPLIGLCSVQAARPLAGKTFRGEKAPDEPPPEIEPADQSP